MFFWFLIFQGVCFCLRLMKYVFFTCIFAEGCVSCVFGCWALPIQQSHAWDSIFFRQWSWSNLPLRQASNIQVAISSFTNSSRNCWAVGCFTTWDAIQFQSTSYFHSWKSRPWGKPHASPILSNDDCLLAGVVTSFVTWIEVDFKHTFEVSLEAACDLQASQWLGSHETKKNLWGKPRARLWVCACSF